MWNFYICMCVLVPVLACSLCMAERTACTRDLSISFAVWFSCHRRIRHPLSLHKDSGRENLSISGEWVCILTIGQSFSQSQQPKTLWLGFCGHTKGIELEKAYTENDKLKNKICYLLFALCSSICSAHSSPDGGHSEHYEPVLAATRKTQWNHSGLWD